MSNDVTTFYGGPPPDPPSRRRRLWVAAGAAGLTGIVGLAALGGLAARNQDSGGRERTSDTKPVAAPRTEAATTPRGDDTGAHGGQDSSGREGEAGVPGGERPGRDGAQDKGQVRRVPCDTDKLIEAIEYANANHGGALELAKDCTYELTRSDDGNGLPVIRQAITLRGENSRITRAANANLFRILNVARDGHLRLEHVTIKGGQTGPDLVPQPRTPAATPGKPSAVPAKVAQLVDPGPSDGAGLLVQRGGQADLEHSQFVLHNAGGNGGSIANYGTTRLASSLVETSSAAGTGGGVFNAGVLRVENSKVTTNSAQDGGGIGNGTPTASVPGGTVWVWQSIVHRNRALGTGGGLLDHGGATTLSRSEVLDNTAATSGAGLVVRADGQLALEQVRVSGNLANGTGGGLLISGGSTAVIEHGSIKENVAEQYGGGIVNVGAAVVLRESEVVGNRAVAPNSLAGGIFNSNGQVRLEKSTVAYNFSNRAPGGIYTDDDGVRLSRDSVVTANRPTNCAGSPVVPDRCFG